MQSNIYIQKSIHLLSFDQCIHLCTQNLHKPLFHTVLVGTLNCTTILGKVLAIPCERKYILTLRPKYLIPRHLPKINENAVPRGTSTRTFPASFIPDPSWKQPSCRSPKTGQPMVTHALEMRVNERQWRKAGCGNAKER